MDALFNSGLPMLSSKETRSFAVLKLLRLFMKKPLHLLYLLLSMELRAVEQLGTITEDKLNEICGAVNVSRFRPVEFTYMNKY